MARVTVEDCIEKVDNRFDLVLLSAHRARMISTGAEPTLLRDRDKNPVLALREIAEGSVDSDDLTEEYIHALQNQVEVDDLEAEAELPIPIAESESSEEEGQGFILPVSKPEPVAFDKMSEEDLLRGIEGLVPPDRRSDDF